MDALRSTIKPPTNHSDFNFKKDLNCLHLPQYRWQTRCWNTTNWSSIPKIQINQSGFSRNNLKTNNETTHILLLDLTKTFGGINWKSLMEDLKNIMDLDELCLIKIGPDVKTVGKIQLQYKWLIQHRHKQDTRQLTVPVQTNSISS